VPLQEQLYTTVRGADHYGNSIGASAGGIVAEVGFAILVMAQKLRCTIVARTFTIRASSCLKSKKLEEIYQG